MIAYLSGFKRKKWKDLTPEEKIAVIERKREIMSDPETKSVHQTLVSFAKEQKKKREKFQKLREYLIREKLQKTS